jgi:hypothetical protein
MNKNQPFFILGNPRSGTSLFRLMLNAHPKIIVPPECGFLQWWYNKYKDWDAEASGDLKQISTFLKDLSTSKKIEGWRLNNDSLQARIVREVPKSYADLVCLVYRMYNPEKEGIIGDKNNYYISHIDFLKSLFPEASFIHLVRDGRDVAVSYLDINKNSFSSAYAPHLPSEISEIANEWSTNVSKIQSAIKDRKHLELRYEDLITQPKSTLGRVCRFLKLEFSTEMLEYYKEEKHDEPDITMEWKPKTKSKIDASNVGRYKSYLTPEQIRQFHDVAQGVLENFDYE